MSNLDGATPSLLAPAPPAPPLLVVSDCSWHVGTRAPLASVPFLLPFSAARSFDESDQSPTSKPEPVAAVVTVLSRPLLGPTPLPLTLPPPPPPTPTPPNRGGFAPVSSSESSDRISKTAPLDSPPCSPVASFLTWPSVDGTCSPANGREGCLFHVGLP